MFWHAINNAIFTNLIQVIICDLLNIDKAKKYFKKVLKTDFPDDTHEWLKIKDYQKLRNCIVHNQGKVNERLKDGPTLQDIIAQTQGLALHGDTVYLDKEFCAEAFQVIKTFLKLLLFPEK